MRTQKIYLETTLFNFYVDESRDAHADTVKLFEDIAKGKYEAIATVNDLDIIISMNFRHIVKRRTILATGKINNLNGYRAIEIYSPMEVVEDENS